MLLVKYVLATVLIGLVYSELLAQNQGVSAVQDLENILPEKARADIQNEWLQERFDTILPKLMERAGIDMWLGINREYNEDPVYLTLVPEPHMFARRLSILIFYYRSESNEVERYTGNFYNIGDWYSSIYTDITQDQFEVLADFIKEKDPRRIGINVSDDFALADGLSASLQRRLEKGLGNTHATRLVSAEKLAVGWLETRIPAEISVYRYICGIAHDVIGEFFSNKVIVPGITTSSDVVWWIRQRFTDLGLKTWFQPSVDIQRTEQIAMKYKSDPDVIRRGDVLHCDIGITYLGLNTDTQEMAYVLHENESEVPEGLKEALRRANRVQDIFMGEFIEGSTGNEILLRSLDKARLEGLNASIYTHPIGFNGHAAGPTIGLWDKQEAIPGKGDYPLYDNTAYSIELNNIYNVPEWDGQEVRIPLEEDAVFSDDVCTFLDGRQTEFYMIR